MSPPLTLGPPWRALVECAGSATALAEKLGVSRNALYTWINGTKHPRKPTRSHVDAFAAANRLPRPFGGK
jgi:hypothetical protein